MSVGVGTSQELVFEFSMGLSPTERLGVLWGCPVPTTFQP